MRTFLAASVGLALAACHGTIVIPGPPHADVAAGYAHTCLAGDDGVRCFGSNPNGQLGTGEGAGTWEVGLVGRPSLGPVDALYAGGDYSCATVDDALWCWGENGEDTAAAIATIRPQPARVAVPVLTDVDLGVAGAACGVDELGSVWCWGGLFDGLRGPDAVDVAPSVVDVASARDVAVGGYFACALGDDGVDCWGCTDPAADPPCAAPHGPVHVDGADAAVAIDAGRAEGCALDAAGVVSCWGGNLWGATGDGTTEPGVVPVPIALPAPAVRVELGWDFGCALLDDATVSCWGYCLGGFGPGPAGPYTQCLGVGDVPSPVPVADIVDLAAGGAHACALDADGATWCWGWNAYGQLGDGGTTDAYDVVARVAVR